MQPSNNIPVAVNRVQRFNTLICVISTAKTKISCTNAVSACYMQTSSAVWGSKTLQGQDILFCFYWMGVVFAISLPLGLLTYADRTTTRYCLICLIMTKVKLTNEVECSCPIFNITLYCVFLLFAENTSVHQWSLPCCSDLFISVGFLV